MIIAIVGSRDGLDWAAAKKTIGFLVNRPDVSMVVTGGARGIDSLAESMALAAGKKVHVIRADWKRYGRSAGIRRNPDIVEMAAEVHAIWNGKSNGTQNTVDIARRKGKPTYVYELPSEFR